MGFGFELGDSKNRFVSGSKGCFSLCDCVIYEKTQYIRYVMRNTRHELFRLIIEGERESKRSIRIR